jgi:hypothetical protein
MSMSSIALLGIASEHPTRMTVLEALAVLEAAVLECKKRDVNTPEVREALDFLERW